MRHIAAVAESLLVVASVGVQLTTTFASGRQTAMFYNIGDISGIVINEAVTMVKHCVVVDSHYNIIVVVFTLRYHCHS